MYKIKEYENLTSEFDKEMFHQYNLVKALSKGFKEENASALTLDKILSQKLKKLFGENQDQKLPGEDKTAKERAHLRVYEMLSPLIERGVNYGEIGKVAISNSQLGFEIRKGTIYVTKVDGKKVDFQFNLHNFYLLILDDLGMTENDIRAMRKRKRTVKQKDTINEYPIIQVNADKPIIQEVERISEEVRFIKRYILLEGKTKSGNDLRPFANAVRKAILDKKIRNTSEYANEIEYIQEKLIYFCNNYPNPTPISINAGMLERFRQIAASEKPLLSVPYLKRYFNMQSNKLDKEKAQRLIDLIEKAIDRKKIQPHDPYLKRIKNALKLLQEFIETRKPHNALKLDPVALNGIQMALDGCGCEKPDEPGKPVGVRAVAVAQHEPRQIISSLDFDKMAFEPIGLFGRWHTFLGDAVRGFIAMIFGKPKLGKSYLAIDFAGYLANYFGRVLYVTKEEGFSASFYQKIKDKQAVHPNLLIANEIPDDLSSYDFVFFDSATRLNMAPDDIAFYKAQYPDKSFIYVFQSTKDGNFRGSQEFEHDVDIVIEVYDLGKARQFGRFNQGGEMDIFDDLQPDEYQQAA